LQQVWVNSNGTPTLAPRLRYRQSMRKATRDYSTQSRPSCRSSLATQPSHKRLFNRSRYFGSTRCIVYRSVSHFESLKRMHYD
jgi:hypothetical protein